MKVRAKNGKIILVPEGDEEIVSVAGMRMVKTGGVLVPLSSYLKTCPDCGGDLRYRKTDHYGPEGKWCDACNKFVYRTW